MDVGLNDRVYVVTAASSGLGFATAQQLVAEGARVVLVGRRAALLEDRVRELGAEHSAALVADLAEPDAGARAAALALERWGRLDGALVSTGGPPRGGVADNDDDQWRTAFESVFLAVLRTLRAVRAAATGPDLALGVVLSTSSRTPLASMAISNGLRPGLAMLVKQAADEWGPRGTRVFGLMPGSIGTERMDFLFSHAEDPARARAEAEERIPLRRLGTPEEFGKVAAFLLSPAASYVSGSLIAVDGGAMRTV